jgi:hypothetical protein
VRLDDISSVADLDRLPTLSKDAYRRSLMFDESSVLETEYISHTTGTTGALTWRHRSVAEASVVNRLFGHGAERAHGQLMLVIRYDRHGMAMPVPGQTRGIPIDLSDDTALRQSVEMLTATYRFPEGVLRPTVVVGGAHDVAVLAQAWLETRTPADSISVRKLHLLGYVDAGLCGFLHSAFNGPEISEKYSLTEIFGGATRRWPATSFALDPYVVGEVVDEDGAVVPRGGVGELVLTELFPFVQMQPLIRYRTGDVVHLVDDQDDDLRFEWWGRRHDCILAHVDGERSWVLGYRPIADWLSLNTLVARQPHKSYLSSVTSTDLGPPCVAIRSEPDGPVRVDVGLRINPWWEKEAVHGLARELWTALRSMTVVPPANVRVRLGFRHVPRPIEDFSAIAGTHDLQLPVGVLSGPVPLP